MTARPYFSPAMLRLFLHARCRMAHDLRSARCSYQVSARQEQDRLRKLSGITANAMAFAFMGRLQKPEPRARLWAILGHHPSDFGIVLTHGGQDG